MIKTLKNSSITGSPLTNFLGGAKIVHDLMNNFNNYDDDYYVKLEEISSVEELKAIESILKEENIKYNILPAIKVVLVKKIVDREEYDEKNQLLEKTSKFINSILVNPQNACNNVGTITKSSASILEKIYDDIRKNTGNDELLKNIMILPINKISDSDSILLYDLVFINNDKSKSSNGSVFLTIEHIEVTCNFESADEIDIRYPSDMNQYKIASIVRQFSRLTGKDLRSVFCGNLIYDQAMHELIFKEENKEKSEGLLLTPEP